jgi:hypothetical protein
MRDRFGRWIVVTAVIAVGLLFGLSSATAQPTDYQAPLTADGQPDFEGFWTNATRTPLQRPDGVVGEFYSVEEVATIEARAAEHESAPTVAGTTADVHYDNSQFGLNRSQSTLATGLRTSLIFDPPDGRIPPITAEGQRVIAQREEEASLRGGRFDSAENNQLDDRCIVMSGSGPPMMDAGYNSNYQIVQNRDYVMILTEMIHDVRIIPLDGREQADDKIRQWMGTSRGHWEGDTLVVETANFNGKKPFPWLVLPPVITFRPDIIKPTYLGSTENMRVTERFTRVDDETIDYKFTVDDQTMWARPWSAELPMKKTIGPLFEHACHEGNYGLANTLAGARLEERLAAEEAAAQKSN